jgi:hypothetical protein
MAMTVFKLVSVVTSVLLLTSCTWVRLTSAGENVAVLSQAEVASCTRTGTTTVEVRDKLVLDRNADKVAQELRTLARNRASDRGDAIVPSSRVENGEQTFIIYRCRN